MNLREKINFRLCVIFLSPGSWTFSLLELSTSFSFACSLVRKEYEHGKQNLQCSSIQRKWQGYLCSLNKQQFFGIVRKGHYVRVYISKEFSARMVRQNAWVILLFNEKVWDCEYIYIQWFWLQIVMVSPGTYLVKNIQSQSRNIESPMKRIYKLLGPLCYQTVNLT